MRWWKKYILYPILFLVALDILLGLVAWMLMSSAKRKYESIPELQYSSYETPNVTPEENSFELFKGFDDRLDALVKEKNKEKKEKKDLSQYFYVKSDESPQYFSTEEFRRQVEFIDELECNFPDIEKAVEKKYSFNPEYMKAENVAGWLSPMLESRNLASYLRLRAVVAAYRGDEDRVIESLMMIRKLTRHVAGSAISTIAYMIAEAIEGIMMSHLALCSQLLGDNFHPERYEILFEDQLAEIPMQIVYLDSMYTLELMVDTFKFFPPDYPYSDKLNWAMVAFNVSVPAFSFWKKYRAYKYASEVKEYWEMPLEQLRELESKTNNADTVTYSLSNPWLHLVGTMRDFYSKKPNRRHLRSLYLEISKYIVLHNEIPSDISDVAKGLNPELFINTTVGKPYFSRVVDGVFTLMTYRKDFSSKEVALIEEELQSFRKPGEFRKAIEESKIKEDK